MTQHLPRRRNCLRVSAVHREMLRGKLPGHLRVLPGSADRFWLSRFEGLVPGEPSPREEVCVSRSEGLTLEQAAAVAGHARWLETRLFEVLGSWVAVEPDPAVKVLWSNLSRRHAAHAGGWHHRQPRVAHLDPERLTVAAGAGVTSLVAALGSMVQPAETVPRLVAVARVIEPRLQAAYRARVEQAHPLADGPTVRWIAVLLADGDAAVAAAGALLDARLRTPDGAGATEAHATALAALLSADGDLIG